MSNFLPFRAGLSIHGGAWGDRLSIAALDYYSGGCVSAFREDDLGLRLARRTSMKPTFSPRSRMGQGGSWWNLPDRAQIDYSHGVLGTNYFDVNLGFRLMRRTQ